MTKTRPKPTWWSWKCSDPFNKVARRLNRKGNRRVRDRETARLIEEQR